LLTSMTSEGAAENIDNEMLIITFFREGYKNFF
jgi:hypothetical protein